MNFIRKVKTVAKKILPTENSWSGNYSDWKEAISHCSGYDAPNIMEKVKIATLKVMNGEAVYERDSVLFDKIEYSWPLLSALMFVAARNKGSLKVLDFGGSLGSSYFQNKLFLDQLDNVTWNIVEQENYVKCGREFIKDKNIRFFYTIDECIAADGIPDIAILSCTLPYFEKPYALLDTIIAYKIPYLIIDNTPFNWKEEDRLCVQKVPPTIYEATYPCWLLSYDKLLAMVKTTYDLITEHQNEMVIYVNNKKIPYRGFFAQLKS